MNGSNEEVRRLIMEKLREKRIEVLVNGKVKSIQADGVHLEDDRFLKCNVPVWATGAEP